MLKPIANRDGVALPLALLGMVLASFLATAALVSSSTEVAASGAHQDATASVYAADAALEGFLAERAAAGAIGAGSATYTSPDLPSSAEILVAQLFRGPVSDDGTRLSRSETFSVLSRLSGGGRQVGSMVTTTSTLDKINLNIQAGMVSGGDVKIHGSKATISDTSALCDSASAKFALQVSKESKLTLSGSPTIDGAVDSTTYSKSDLKALVLGGRSLDDLAKYATIRLKGDPAKRANATFSLLGVDSLYNWGCPVGMEITCPGYTDHMPVVDIDALGGEVSINGDYGQGMLIIRNGSLRIAGNFKYKGIILVEQDVRVLAATGGDGKIEGSVVAFGTGSEVEDNVGGNAKIYHNRCSIVEAQSRLSLQALGAAPKQFGQRSTGWFEIVR